MSVAAVGLTSCEGMLAGDKRQSRLTGFERRSDVDSAFVALKNADDGDVIPLANQLFHLLGKSETTDSLIQYASTANCSEVTANADYWMAEYLYQTQRQKEAMTLAQIALNEAKSLGDNDLQVSINSLLSAIYSRLGMFEEGLRCLELCYEESRRTGNKENQSSDLNNMAAMFISLKQYDKAKQHIDKAIAIERELQKSVPFPAASSQGNNRDAVLAIRLGIASETYMLLDLLDEAEAFAREAFELDSRAGRSGKAAIRLSQLASVQQKQGKLAEAKATLEQAIPVLKECGITYSYIICENQLGDVFLEQKDFANAEAHYRTALGLSEGNEYKYMKQRALNGLWRALKPRDAKAAAAYLEQYTQLTDTLHTEATERQLANMQAQFEFAELQAENERLVYKGHINTLLWVASIVACLLIITILSYIIYAKNKAAIIARQTGVVLELIEEKGKTENVENVDNIDNVENVENVEKVDNLDNDDDKEKTEAPTLPEKDAEFLNQFVSFVNKSLTKGKPVDAAECASHMCLSPRHFSRKVMAITGFTPSAYINRIKINRAKRLLDTKPDMSITEISTRSGFEDLAYFGKMFKQIEGKTPTQYRNDTAQYRKNDQ